MVVALAVSAIAAVLGVPLVLLRIIRLVTTRGFILIILVPTVDGAGLLHLFADLVGLLLQFFEVPFRGLSVGEGGDEVGEGHGVLFLLGVVAVAWGLGEDAWDESAFGDLVLFAFAGDDDGVDGEVGGHVPHLGGRLAAFREVLEDEVVELVEEDAADLFVGEGCEERRAPVEGDVVVVRVEGDAGRGKILGGHLADVPRQFSKEGRILEERDEMAVEVVVRLNGVEHS